jgi:hypothetical protein
VENTEDSNRLEGDKITKRQTVLTLRIGREAALHPENG